jgi:hypothetical protein
MPARSGQDGCRETGWKYARHGQTPPRSHCGANQFVSRNRPLPFRIFRDCLRSQLLWENLPRGLATARWSKTVHENLLKYQGLCTAAQRTLQPLPPNSQEIYKKILELKNVTIFLTNAL